MKGISCLWLGRINIVKVSVLLNAIYRFSAIPIEILMAFFSEVEKNTPKMYMESQKVPNSQRNLEKEQQSRRHHTP